MSILCRTNISVLKYSSFTESDVDKKAEIEGTIVTMKKDFDLNPACSSKAHYEQPESNKLRNLHSIPSRLFTNHAKLTVFLSTNFIASWFNTEKLHPLYLTSLSCSMDMLQSESVLSLSQWLTADMVNVLWVKLPEWKVEYCTDNPIFYFILLKSALQNRRCSQKSWNGDFSLCSSKIIKTIKTVLFFFSISCSMVLSENLSALTNWLFKY